MTRRIPIALALACCVAACAAPKKEDEVLNRPPSFDPVNATGDGSLVVETGGLSDDPEARRKELLSRCYGRAISTGRAVSGERAHTVILSASVSAGKLDASYAPRTYGDAVEFEDCIASTIQAGVFEVPRQGVFTWHAIEATQRPTSDGEETSIEAATLRSSGITAVSYASARDANIEDVLRCEESTAGNGAHPPFAVMATLEVPAQGQGGTASVAISWDDATSDLQQCVRRAVERMSFPISGSNERFARYIFEFPARR